MGNIGNGVINTFIDGDIVSANGTAPALLRSALNPKMQIIQTAIDDNDSRIAILEGQLASIGSSSVQYNVKAAPFNAVGNGIADDTAAIQAAINEAVANQGVVVFPTGTYKLTDTLTITGTCALVTDGASTGVILQQTVASKMFFTITASNVSISDLRLTHTANPGLYFISAIGTVSAYRINILINRCVFSHSYPNYSGNFIEFIFVDNATVTNCKFSGGSYAFGSSGIYMLSCKNSIILRNTFLSYLSIGIMLMRINGTSLATYPACENITISQNYFQNIALMCISMWTVSNIYISGNTFKTTGGADPSTNNTYATIKARASVDPSNVPLPNYYLTITENYIDNISSAPAWIGAVFLSRTYDSILSDNIFYGNGLGPQFVGSELVMGNVFLESTCANINVVGCTFIRPNIAGVALGGISTSPPFDTNTSIIANNVFIDVNIGTGIGVTSKATAILHLGTSAVSVSGNVLRRGSLASAGLYINSYGYYNIGFSETYSGSGAFVHMASNDFTLAQDEPIKTYTGTAIVLYYTEPTGDRVFKGFSSAPMSGTWQQGDKVLIASPTAGGYIGYVCTTAGTPGTWKGYGAIQA